MIVFDIIVEAINASLSLFISCIFFRTFWNKKYNSKISSIIFCIGTILLTLTLLLFKGTPLVFIMLFATTFAQALMYQSKLSHKIIFTGLLLGILSILEMIIAFLMSTILKVELVSIKSGILYVTGMLFSKCILYFLVSFIQALKHKPLIGKSDIKYWSILLFPLSSAIIILIQHAMFINSPNQSTVVSYIVLIGYSLLLFANIMIFDIIDSLYDQVLYESRMAMADKIIDSQKTQYQDLIKSTQQIIKVRHDYKNFCIGLASEIKSGNFDTAIRLLQNEYESNSSMGDLSADVIHTVVEAKTKDAGQKGIVIDFEYHELQKLTISSIDIAVILGNALDNAIEASEKVKKETPKISVYIVSKNNTIMMTIKNPTIEDVDVENLATTKPDVAKHGFGIVGMRQLIAKYDGEILFNCENKVFTVTIVLVNTQKNNE